MAFTFNMHKFISDFYQLAILASYSGDDLLSVYRYFRSLAVDSPFSTARDNLIIAFEKVLVSKFQVVTCWHFSLHTGLFLDVALACIAIKIKMILNYQP